MTDEQLAEIEARAAAAQAGPWIVDGAWLQQLIPAGTPDGDGRQHFVDLFREVARLNGDSDDATGAFIAAARADVPALAAEVRRLRNELDASDGICTTAILDELKRLRVIEAAALARRDECNDGCPGWWEQDDAKCTCGHVALARALGQEPNT